MMNKKLKQRLSETLDKALAPPRKRGHLDNLLEEYDDGSRLVPSTSRATEKVSAHAIISPAEVIAPAEKFSGQPMQSSAAAIITPPEIPAAHEIISHPEQHLRIPNELLDRVFPTLMPSDQSVLLRLYRLTRGFHNDTIKVSMGKLAIACHLSSRQVTTCVQRLERRKLIEKVSVDWSNKNQAERGVVIKILLPAVPREKISAPAKSSRAEKSTAAEENAAIKDLNTKETNTQTQQSVSGASRFSLEECRRYADHLKTTGQGITNPGGYATKVFRSGEADAFIEAFLTPSMQIDIDKCQECGGIGFIYIDPSNHDRGVRPCKHDSLKARAQ
jgi:hypothetical protein